MAQTIKSLPAVQETWVQSLRREDPWRRKWQPTPIFLPGESHGQSNLVGSPWNCKESDTTEQFHFHFSAYLGGNPRKSQHRSEENQRPEGTN